MKQFMCPKCCKETMLVELGSDINDRFQSVTVIDAIEQLCHCVFSKDERALLERSIVDSVDSAECE